MTRRANNEEYINERCKQFKTSDDYLKHMEEYKKMREDWKKPSYFFRTRGRPVIPYRMDRTDGSSSPGNKSGREGASVNSAAGGNVTSSSLDENGVNSANTNNIDNSGVNAGNNSTQVNVSASTAGSPNVGRDVSEGGAVNNERGAGVYTWIELERKQKLQERQQQLRNKKPIKEIDRSMAVRSICRAEFYPNVKSIDEMDWFKHPTEEAAIPRIPEISDNKVPGPGHYTSKHISCGMQQI